MPERRLRRVNMKKAIVLPVILLALLATGYGQSGKSAPGTAGAFLERGIMFAMRGDYEGAIAEFTDALVLEPEMSEIYLLRGRAFYANVSKVLKVEKNFSHIDVLTGGSSTYAQDVVYDKAIADFTQAIRLDPNNVVAYRERGFVYGEKGNNDKAIADLTRAIRMDINYALAYATRGNVYIYTSEYDKAIADLNQAIRLDPKLTVAYNDRGISLSNK
jgi:tetratricopeptide (TPR) repeat protein